MSERFSFGDIQMFSDESNTISNVKVFGIPPKLCDHETELRHLYQSNKTCSETAEQVHTHPMSVYNKIRKMKLICPQKWAEYTSTFKGKKELSPQIII